MLLTSVCCPLVSRQRKEETGKRGDEEGCFSHICPNGVWAGGNPVGFGDGPSNEEEAAAAPRKNGLEGRTEREGEREGVPESGMMLTC